MGSGHVPATTLAQRSGASSDLRMRSLASGNGRSRRPNHDKHRGAKSELAAALWLMEQGFEVFRNVSPHGAADIVAIARDGSFIKVDVKTANECAGRIYTSPRRSVPRDVRVLWVARNGAVIGFDLAPEPTERASMIRQSNGVRP